MRSSELVRRGGSFGRPIARRQTWGVIAERSVLGVDVQGAPPILTPKEGEGG